MTERVLTGILGDVNDVRYELKEPITIIVGASGDGYFEANYSPMGIKASDITEDKAIDLLKRNIIRAYDSVKSDIDHAAFVGSGSRKKWEHLSSILERTPYDPRNLEVLITAK